MKQREVAIVHYNTPELTEACILSVRKHGGLSYHITVFDNSDKRPFTVKMDGVTVIDNTQGQVINFENELAKYPKDQYGKVNNYGSDKHMMSVQKLWDIINAPFLLLDSDVLLKKSVDFMFQDDVVAVGHVQNQQPGNDFHLGRLVPMVCYINVPLCRKYGLTYFDENRSWMIHSTDLRDRSNWYDTGASFYEDIHAKKNGCRGLRIDIRPLMEHYKKGSWWGNCKGDHQKWLTQHKQLWSPTPRMKGNKKVAICAIGRNENRYAVEWVEHYKKLGVSKIFVYDNYFNDEEPLATTLKKYVNAGFVEIIDIHDKKAMQHRAYEHCYKMHGDEYAWIGFLDFDEYLRYERKGRKSIETVFAKYHDADCVLVNWRLMTDSGHTHYEDKPLKERFTEVMALDAKVKYDWPENDHVKCFVAGGIGTIEFRSPHHPETPMRCVNASGKTVKNAAFVHPFDHSVMRLDHYWTKTAEEWIGTKLMRGFPSGTTYMDNFIKAQERYFFAVNERTPEKEQILRDGIQKVIDNHENMVFSR
jgi:hypothetical protein